MRSMRTKPRDVKGRTSSKRTCNRIPRTRPERPRDGGSMMSRQTLYRGRAAEGPRGVEVCEAPLRGLVSTSLRGDVAAPFCDQGLCARQRWSTGRRRVDTALCALGRRDVAMHGQEACEGPARGHARADRGHRVVARRVPQHARARVPHQGRK
ncbi:hypothetical protein M885DRAFT_542506 [Pelagophyceae sp. CCMP2097]|nr:hypothetical protein M885DRAFT_542506 [Pelagophyceae sp. CCMP2097]